MSTKCVGANIEGKKIDELDVGTYSVAVIDLQFQINVCQQFMISVFHRCLWNIHCN